MKRLHFIVVLAAAVSLMLPSLLAAEPYARPIFGYMVPITGGDSSIAVGGAIGYKLFSTFSVETSYTRLFGQSGAFDSNLIGFTGQLDMPSPAISPFVKAGGGFYKASIPGVDTNFEGYVEFGTGALLTFIPLIDLGAGLSYMAMFDAKDYLYPYLYAGISF